MKRSTMKRAAALLAAGCMTVSLAACGSTATSGSSSTASESAPASSSEAASESTTTSEASSEATATGSGKVTVYMPSPAGLADKLAAAFTEETGIQVEQFQGTTGEILARLETEEANPVADVVILASWSDGLSMKPTTRSSATPPPMPTKSSPAGSTMTACCSVTARLPWA